MKKVLRIFIMAMFISIMGVFSSLADEKTSVEEYSELLPKNVESDTATEQSIRRGEFFARADLVITDEGDGNIGAFAVAYMNRYTYRVYISIYLDRWIEEEIGGNKSHIMMPSFTPRTIPKA